MSYRCLLNVFVRIIGDFKRGVQARWPTVEYLDFSMGRLTGWRREETIQEFQPLLSLLWEVWELMEFQREPSNTGKWTRTFTTE